MYEASDTCWLVEKIMQLSCDLKTIEMPWIVSSGKPPDVLHYQLPVFLRMSRNVSEQSLTSFLTSCSFKESHHRVRPWVCVSFLRIKTVIFYFSAVFLFHNRLFNKFLWTKTVFHFSEFFLFHNKLLSWHNSIKLNTFWRRHSFLISLKFIMFK